MYTPSAFQVDDPTLIRAFIEENSFGILLSSIDGSLIHDTHTPFLLTKDGKSLLGHIAKANTQWNDWCKNPIVKVIFHGPHCYISPTFYRSDFNVPTWNYTAISITGNIEIIDSIQEQKDFLHRLVGKYEHGYSNRWHLDEENERMMKLFSGIVFFRIQITGLQAKFKLNQNKDNEDQESVIKHLSKSASPFDHQVASLMKQNLAEQGSGANG